VDIPQGRLFIQHCQSATNNEEKSEKRGGWGHTDIDLNEDIIPGVIAADIHHLEDSVGEAGGHVDDLL
jgi:hypothetical protein